jgi:hypothetical protein
MVYTEDSVKDLRTKRSTLQQLGISQSCHGGGERTITT